VLTDAHRRKPGIVKNRFLKGKVLVTTVYLRGILMALTVPGVETPLMQKPVIQTPAISKLH
jgi:hypothetical protein